MESVRISVASHCAYPRSPGMGRTLTPAVVKELANLVSMLNDLPRNTTDDDSVQHAVVTMGVGEEPVRFLLEEIVKRSAGPSAAVVDVTEELCPGRDAVGKFASDSQIQ